MTHEMEGVLTNLTAIVVLLTCMIDARISVGLAVVFLFGSGIYKMSRKQV